MCPNKEEAVLGQPLLVLFYFFFNSCNLLTHGGFPKLMVVELSGKPSFRHSLMVACLILTPLGVFLVFSIDPPFVFYPNPVPLQLPDDSLG